MGNLNPGDRAPEFALPAANREESISLAEMLRDGTVVIEFLRGTW